MEINNSLDIIDSRDIIARIEEIQGRIGIDTCQCDPTDVKQLDGLLCRIDDGEDPPVTDDEIRELIALLNLAEQCDGNSEWTYGQALIRDSYFEEYAAELADDIGAIDRNAGWPCNCIDWKQAARELQTDYTPVEFDGVDYWVR